MQKQLAHPRFGEVTAYIHGGISRGLIWGGVAGAVIGAGISVNIGLFYGSAFAFTSAVLIVCGALGGMFGHVMSNLLADDIVFLAHIGAGAPSLADSMHVPDLADYRTLKAEMQAKALSGQEVSDIIHSVRGTPGGAEMARKA